MTDPITTEDLKVRDLFSQAQLEEVGYDPEQAALYCQMVMEGHSLLMAAYEVWAIDHRDEEADTEARLEARIIDQNEFTRWKKRKGHPFYKITNRWRVTVSKFDEMVNLAMRQRCYHFLEDIIDISDDATDDVTMGAQGPIINGKAIRRAELMINTRKFVMSKMLPKVFGDKTQMELTGADGKDLGPTTFNIQLVPAGNFLTQEQAAKSAEERDNGDV